MIATHHPVEKTKTFLDAEASFLANYMFSQDIPMLVYQRMYTATVAQGYGYLFCNTIALQHVTFRNILTFQRLHARTGVNLLLEWSFQRPPRRLSSSPRLPLFSLVADFEYGYTTATWDAISRLLSSDVMLRLKRDLEACVAQGEGGVSDEAFQTCRQNRLGEADVECKDKLMVSINQIKWNNCNPCLPSPRLRCLITGSQLLRVY